MPNRKHFPANGLIPDFQDFINITTTTYRTLTETDHAMKGILIFVLQWCLCGNNFSLPAATGRYLLVQQAEE